MQLLAPSQVPQTLPYDCTTLTIQAGVDTTFSHEYELLFVLKMRIIPKRNCKERGRKTAVKICG